MTSTYGRPVCVSFCPGGRSVMYQCRYRPCWADEQTQIQGAHFIQGPAASKGPCSSRSPAVPATGEVFEVPTEAEGTLGFQGRSSAPPRDPSWNQVNEAAPHPPSPPAGSCRRVLLWGPTAWPCPSRSPRLPFFPLQDSDYEDIY